MYSKIAPTLNARDSHEPRYILEEVKIIGQMDNTLDNTFESANRVYDKNGLCLTIPTCAGGGIQPKVIEDIHCVAMRGRNPEHPSDRTRGAKMKQRLEMNWIKSYRIRKLTPKECWRLMGYSDRDFEKAAEVNSNTQLYKQAGNAIVKQVLMAIFSQLLN